MNISNIEDDVQHELLVQFYWTFIKKTILTKICIFTKFTICS